MADELTPADLLEVAPTSTLFGAINTVLSQAQLVRSVAQSFLEGRGEDPSEWLLQVTGVQLRRNKSVPNDQQG